MELHQPSIEYLELFGVAVAVVLWIRRFRNQRIILFCDNTAMTHMINNSSSTCKQCMVLIRYIVLESLRCNVRIKARYVSSKDNGKADALSRLDLNRFWSLSGGDMNCPNTAIPDELWPIDKLWILDDSHH